MKHLLIILMFCFTYQSSFAENISDFKIEGMSIGDSLLDYYNEKKIINSKMNYFGTERQYYVVGISENLKTYNTVEIYLKTNDKNYEIKTIAGKLKIKNQKNCFDIKHNITIDKHGNKKFSGLLKL